MNTSEAYTPISDDVVSRALKAKTYVKQAYNQQVYSPGSLVSLDIPSLPQFFVPSLSWHEWELSVNYTANNLDATTGGGGSINAGVIALSQFFPHCAILRSQIISSNGQSISNIQNYAQLHMAKVLLSGIDANVKRMNLTNVNVNWTPYANSLSARAEPYVMGSYSSSQKNIVATGTGTCKLTVNTQFGMLPIFELDSLIDLASMSSQTRSSFRFEAYLDIQQNWITAKSSGTNTGGGSGAGAPTLDITSVEIRPSFYMCLLQPTIELASVVQKLVNDNSFIIPVTSYLTQTAVLSGNQKQLGLTCYVDEESVGAVYCIHQLSVASHPLTAVWDAVNNFTSAHVQTFQITAGGSYFPSYSPITRSDAAAASGVPINNFDAIQFQRHVLNIKTDVDVGTGTMITPKFFNTTVALPTVTDVANTLQLTSSECAVDFFIGYSFETGAVGAYSGFNMRANGGTFTVNLTYNASQNVPNCSVYVYSEFDRAYLLTVGGLIYLTKDQYRASVASMSPRSEELLNKLLHISGAY
jgi:hypothetical protein